MMRSETKTDNTTKSQPAGFTVVELMLAMAGIAFLLLFVVFAITHATNLYSKGIAVRQINQVGRQVSDEISREIRYGGEPKILVDKHRLCIGSKSYIWNNANTSPTDPNANKRVDNSMVGLIRLDSGEYCDAGSPAIANDEDELLGNIARLMDMSITEPVAGSGVYEVSMTFGTALDQPTLQPTGRYECSPVNGQFCAMGEFDLLVYARGR